MIKKLFWLPTICLFVLAGIGALRAWNYRHTANLAHAVELKNHSIEITRLQKKLQKSHRGDFLVEKSGKVCLITASMPGENPLYLARCSVNSLSELRLDALQTDYVLLQTKDVVLYGEPGHAEAAVSFAQQ